MRWKSNGDPNIVRPTGHMSRSLEQRVWRKVDQSGGLDACWPWTSNRLPTGYGRVQVDRKLQRAHRVVWALVNGPIPAGLVVCHKCDNPPCCNPAHLFLGTYADNIADRTAKGRTRVPAGADQWQAKLTPSQVRAIRIAHTNGATVMELMQRHSVARTVINRVVTRLTYQNVE